MVYSEVAEEVFAEGVEDFTNFSNRADWHSDFYDCFGDWYAADIWVPEFRLEIE